MSLFIRDNFGFFKYTEFDKVVELHKKVLEFEFVRLLAAEFRAL